MHSSVVCVFLLSVLIAIVSAAVDGANTSVSQKLPTKLEGRTIICNAVQDSHCKEAIKSLEATLVATMEKKFEQLLAEMNKTSHENSAGKVSLMLFYLFFCLIFLTSLNFVHFVL